MQHIDEGLIHAWLDDALEPGERANVEAHIAACADCRRHVDQERSVITRAADILATATPPVLAAPPFQQLRPPAPRHTAVWSPVRLTWAATVVLAIGIGWFGRAWLGTDSVATDALETMSAPVETMQAAQATPSAPETPVAVPLARMAPQTLSAPPVVTAPSASARNTAEWVSTSAESAERESGMPLVRLAGAQLVDVATRVNDDRVEVRTRQRLSPDTAIIELVQAHELPQADAEAVAAMQPRAKALPQSAPPTTTNRQLPLMARAADAPVTAQTTAALSVVTVMRDGIVITARATLPHDSLLSLLQRLRE